ncbi:MULTISPECIES: potassium channel family protein [Bacillaceae]|uniref:potassium channel family protein n=1 Tax=Bacillaceae TaxID=186817 RepID=UPI002A169F73|nr:potassium channel family protein [Cytobacillus sp. IB215316]MDX8359233.1 potassium channel family protein [Cytobacillus sp. IB215316]
MIIIKKIIVKLVRFNNWILFTSTIALIACSSLIMMYLEPETFTTPFEGVWWVMTTVTTVGYGDLYPVTTLGRLYAIFLYLVGIGLIGVIIGKIVDFFATFRRKREEGRVHYKGENHLVIIGWSRKANFAIEEILQSESKIELVIIDTLEKSPIINDRVHYVQGYAADNETLSKANISKCKAAIIFADDSIHDVQLIDGKSLLIATAIERLVPNIHTTVEILSEEHIQNFVHVKVDEFVLTHETVSRMAVRSAFTKGISAVYTQLISRNVGDDLYQIKAKSEWKTYRDAFEQLLEAGATLIADKDKLNINRMLDKPIPKNTYLYVICDKNTYQKIS